MERIIYSFVFILSSLSLCSSAFSSSDPVSFSNNKQHLLIENRGQVRDQFQQERKDIRFKINASNGLSIFVGKGALHYQFGKAEKNAGEPVEDYLTITKSATTFTLYRMDVVLVGANPDAAVIKEEPSAYYEQYYTDWSGEAGVRAASFAKITYKNIYPHIDWILYLHNGQLKHEFVVHTGGRVSDIRLRYDGATGLNINEDKGLTAHTPLGTVIEQAPVSYQQDGSRVQSAFRLDGTILSYDVASYQGDLVIDPTLDWATYYGDTGWDVAFGVATDRTDNVYLTGQTTSKSNIATTGSFSSIMSGSVDAFLAKYNTSCVPLWATYYGGVFTSSGDGDSGYGIAADKENNVYLCGHTVCPSGIATAGAHQTVAGGMQDGYLVKFDSSGSRLWATYMGGSGHDQADKVVIDPYGNAYICGHTESTSGIAGPGAYQAALDGTRDAFVAKFNASGKCLWSTYFGGPSDDYGTGLVTDKAGKVYLGGYTHSNTGIATAGAHQSVIGSTGFISDAFLVKFDTSGARVWGTYYGGTGNEIGRSLARDTSDHIYLCGSTSSTTAIATAGAFKSTVNGIEAFLVKFDTSGKRLWGTYYGDSDALTDEDCYSVATDLWNNVYMTGKTDTTSALATTDAYKAKGSGILDAYLVRFDPGGNRLWGTYFGGPKEEFGHCIATDRLGNAYLTGPTASAAGISTPAADRMFWSGGIYDAFLVKFCFGPKAAAITGKDSVCTPSSIMLSTKLEGGAWYSKTGKTSVSAGKVTGITPGTDTIVYVLANRCYSDTVYKKIIVKPGPFAGVISTGDSVCLGKSITLSSTGTGGSWLSKTGKSSITGTSLKGLSAGFDTVLYIVTNACGADTARKKIKISDCTTGILQSKPGTFAHIAPNPAKELVTISAAVVINELVLFDLAGRILYTAEPLSKQVELNLSSLPQGIYCIKINGYSVQKIVRE